MSNPVFDSSDIFGNPERRKAKKGQPVGGVDTMAYGANDAVVANAQFEQVQAGYYGPSATPVETGRLTYDDVIVKTAIMLAIIVAVGAVTWSLPIGTMLIASIAGGIGALVFGLINSFKREPSPVMIVLYSAFEGMLLGGFSRLMEDSYPGIVIQAVLGTLITFAVTLALFSSGKVRATPKMVRFIMIALVSYMLLMIANLVLNMTGVLGGSLMNMTVMGIPLGIVVGILAVVLGAFMLIVDFTSIERGVVGGAAAKYSWTAAFGLVVTLVWIYIQFLRLLSMFARR